MNIETKIDLFKNKSLNDFSNVVENLSDHAINIRNQAFARYLFMEKNCQIDAEVLIYKAEASSFIGAFSYINSGGYIRGQVFIGRFCSIGRRVSLGAGFHPLYGISTSPRLFTLKHEMNDIPKNIDNITIIENDVWIGDGAVIMPGVRVGNGAVIAANAVVTKNVSPYDIVGGVPAKKISQRFNEDLVERLLQVKWWNYSFEQLQSYPVNNVEAFLNSIVHDSCDYIYKTLRLST